MSTTDKSRQLLVDTAAAAIKAGKVMRSNESKEMIDHLAILLCRFVDALSTPSAKQFYHSLSQSAWSGIELATDQETTIAIAKVTADLCHKLEMEHYLHQPMSRNKMSKKVKAEKRKERSHFQKQIFLEKKVFDDGAMDSEIVEEVLLDALNVGQGSGAALIEKSSVSKEKNFSHTEKIRKTGQSFLPPQNVAINITEGETCDEVVSLPLSSSVMTESPSVYFHYDDNEDVEIDEFQEDLRFESEPLSANGKTDLHSTKHNIMRVRSKDIQPDQSDSNDIEDLLSSRDIAHSANRRVYDQIKANLGVKQVQYEEDKNSIVGDSEINSYCTEYNSSGPRNSIHTIPPMKKSDKNSDSTFRNIPTQNVQIENATNQYFNAFEETTSDRRITAIRGILNQMHFESTRSPSFSEYIINQIQSNLHKTKQTNISASDNYKREKVKSDKYRFPRRASILFAVFLGFLFLCMLWFILGAYGLYMLMTRNILSKQDSQSEIVVRLVREVIVKAENDKELFVFNEDVNDKFVESSSRYELENLNIAEHVKESLSSIEIQMMVNTDTFTHNKKNSEMN